MSHLNMPGALNSISDTTLATFEQQGLWNGLSALAQERYEKAMRAMEDVDPTDTVGVILAQAQIAFWKRTIPSIYPAFQDYVAKRAITPAVNGARK